MVPGVVFPDRNRAIFIIGGTRESRLSLAGWCLGVLLELGGGLWRLPGLDLVDLHSSK